MTFTHRFDMGYNPMERIKDLEAEVEKLKAMISFLIASETTGNAEEKAEFYAKRYTEAEEAIK